MLGVAWIWLEGRVLMTGKRLRLDQMAMSLVLSVLNVNEGSDWCVLRDGEAR